MMHFRDVRERCGEGARSMHAFRGEERYGERLMMRSRALKETRAAC